jgi:hypothetical protein
MTRVVSIRVPVALERAVRANANRSRMQVSQIVHVILEHSLCGQYNFGALPDAQEFLDAKLDVRLACELVSKLRAESQRLQVQVSVYIRTILYAYYTKRLVFVEKEGHYTLEAKNEQSEAEIKSA